MSEFLQFVVYALLTAGCVVKLIDFIAWFLPDPEAADRAYDASEFAEGGPAYDPAHHFLAQKPERIRIDLDGAHHIADPETGGPKS